MGNDLADCYTVWQSAAPSSETNVFWSFSLETFHRRFLECLQNCSHFIFTRVSLPITVHVRFTVHFRFPEKVSLIALTIPWHVYRQHYWHIPELQLNSLKVSRFSPEEKMRWKVRCHLLVSNSFQLPNFFQVRVQESVLLKREKDGDNSKVSKCLQSVAIYRS